MSYTCIIVDDEPIAQEILEDYITQVHELNLVKKCANAVEAFDVLLTQPIDIMYLDIQMPKINGISFVQSLKDPPQVILTTAHPNYALEGYSINAIDYLLKPISFERFWQATQKAFAFVNKPQPLASINVQWKNEEDYVFVKADRKMVNINLNELLFVEAKNDYVQFHLQNTSIITYSTLSKVEEALPNNRFIRIHRSYIVALDKIDAIIGKHSSVKIAHETIPIGNTYKTQIEQLINTRRLI